MGMLQQIECNDGDGMKESARPGDYTTRSGAMRLTRRWGLNRIGLCSGYYGTRPWDQEYGVYTWNMDAMVVGRIPIFIGLRVSVWEGRRGTLQASLWYLAQTIALHDGRYFSKKKVKNSKRQVEYGRVDSNARGLHWGCGYLERREVE